MLPQTIEYALRAMAYLADTAEKGGARAADIAEAAAIPRHYVNKLLRRLVLAELLTSRRGKGGGFALTRAPGEIRFLDILEAFDFGVGNCAWGYDGCDSEAPCPLHTVWQRLKNNFLTWAHETTLAEVDSTHVKARLRLLSK